jgi:sugar (pentulose or hexulose) kinase
MSKDLILSIDNGTQSIRSLIFDIHGKLLAKEQVKFKPTYLSPEPGWAELPPEKYWESLCTACQALWQKTKIDKQRIAGVSVTTQRGTVVNVDRSGKALRPAILWLDQRKIDAPPSTHPLWAMIFKAMGATQTIDFFVKEAEANWIYLNEPEIWHQTHKYLLLSGYLIHRLIDRFVDSIGAQVGFIPFDYKNLKWAPSWSWQWKHLPITPDMLPTLYPPGHILGQITSRAASATGIPEGLPLVAAAADKACEILGSGAIDPSIGCLSFGTTATMNVTHTKYIEHTRLIPPYPSAIPDCYSIEAQISRGFWMVSWFMEEFGHFEKNQSQKSGVPVEKLFDQMIQNVPAGSMGLILQPFWSPGVKFPGPEAKGGIIGFGDVHTRAHLYRAILEGLAYALREGKERIVKRTRIPLEKLRVSGGGSQSDTAMQITADIFGIPAERPHLYETSGLGAAIDAAVGLNLYPDFSSAIKEMVRTDKRFDPIDENQHIYDQLYESVYKRMYQHLKPLYDKIRHITGYPE